MIAARWATQEKMLCTKQSQITIGGLTSPNKRTNLSETAIIVFGTKSLVFGIKEH